MTTNENPTDFTFTVTSSMLDANGNQVDIEGWDLTRYRENPVVFFNHLIDMPPIGQSTSLTVRGSRMIANIKLAPTPLGDQIAMLIADGYIRGASVGFRPTNWEWRPAANGVPAGINSHQQILMEVSIVGIPANPEALRAAMDSDQALVTSLQPHHLTTIISPVPKADPEQITVVSHMPEDGLDPATAQAMINLGRATINKVREIQDTRFPPESDEQLLAQLRDLNSNLRSNRK